MGAARRSYVAFARAMIGVDWGTSSFRAYRLHHGAILDRIEAGPALLSIPEGGFPAALHSAIGPWLAQGETRVLLAGMVGSRQGWVEAPYLPCPADPAGLAAAAVPVPFDTARVRLVPGLSALDPSGTPEVMRGEEVQLAGVLAQTGPDALVCLPGTHSKWARLAQGRVVAFTTHMTGEVFAALRHHTILGRLMTEAPHDPAAFARGVDRAAEPGGLLHHLFGVRTNGLTGRLDDRSAASFLSGILIGHEIRAAVPDGPVHLVGAPALCTIYAAALERIGARTVIQDQDAAARGLALVAEHVAWT